MTTEENITKKQGAEENSADKRIIILSSNVILKPSTSKEINDLMNERKSFENIRPFPKAEPRKKKRINNGSKSKIYTLTHELEELGRIQADSKRKKSLKMAAVKGKSKKPPVKRSILNDDDSSDSGESDNSIELADTDDFGDLTTEEFPLLESGDLVTQGDFRVVIYTYLLYWTLSVSGTNIKVNFL